ncbi:hypothetical protein K0A97_02535 [Patescibacteria group bacterium]|nr:hypothetical protein [Patescibacteria group bacterium]
MVPPSNIRRPLTQRSRRVQSPRTGRQPISTPQIPPQNSQPQLPNPPQQPTTTPQTVPTPQIPPQNSQSQLPNPPQQPTTTPQTVPTPQIPPQNSQPQLPNPPQQSTPNLQTVTTQPGVPQGTSSVAQPKKSKLGMWLIVILGFLIFLGIGAYLLFFN